MSACLLCCNRSVRLSLPLIKTAALLINHADFAGVPAPQPSTADSTAANNSAETAGANVSIKAGAGSGSVNSGSSSSSFAWGVLQQLKLELKGCGDVAKLLEGAALLAQLACVPDCSASAMQTVMVMLVNRYPKVGLPGGGAALLGWF